MGSLIACVMAAAMSSANGFQYRTFAPHCTFCHSGTLAYQCPGGLSEVGPGCIAVARASGLHSVCLPSLACGWVELLSLVLPTRRQADRSTNLVTRQTSNGPLAYRGDLMCKVRVFQRATAQLGSAA